MAFSKIRDVPYFFLWHGTCSLVCGHITYYEKNLCWGEIPIAVEGCFCIVLNKAIIQACRYLHPGTINTKIDYWLSNWRLMLPIVYSYVSPYSLLFWKRKGKDMSPGILGVWFSSVAEEIITPRVRRAGSVPFMTGPHAPWLFGVFYVL